MAIRKKTKKKSTKSKKSDGRKSPAQKPARNKKTPKKSAKNRTENRQQDSAAFSRESSGLESGDLQGLSNVESADSESVEELLEEGNAFEAGIVSGVEDSREREGKEVRTREVPEDDVPGEYLDEE
jgi:hypothetical protein